MNESLNKRFIVAAKIMALLGFLILLTCTYLLRNEILALSHIKFSADEVRAASEIKQLRDSYPDRLKQHEAEIKHYELENENYRKMLDLYETDYAEYVKRIEAKFTTPPLPTPPTKPDLPEVAEKLYEINQDFRIRKNQYFATSARLNWISCIAAMMLVGGLLCLLMFEDNSQRWHYLVALVISFVFLIGPAFHSIITGIIGFLREPGVN